MESFGLSPRGAANVEAIWPRISAAAAEREKNSKTGSEEVNNQIPCIDLGTSENWVIREELIDLYKNAVHNHLSDRHLSYPDGFAGDSELLEALVGFFNNYFKPKILVEKEQLAIAPGAASSLDALLFNICEAGDGVLVPAPFWNGFDWLLKVRSGVEPVQVSVSSFNDTFSSAIIPALEKAFKDSTRPIKAVLFTNPHNPFGQCYPTSVIQDIIRFCHDKNIHFISDEIYALSKFEVADEGKFVPFMSALELDIEEIGCDLSRVHTIWSISKDLGSSGLRMGCCVTQGNRRLATGLSLAANTQMSSLTAIAATSLLNSPQLPALLALNSKRLAYAYTRMTSFLKEHHFQYIPTNMGPYIFVKLAPKAETWDEEAAAVKSCKDAGVSVSAGRSYHIIESEKGWARLTFAIDPKKLDIALGRLAIGLNVATTYSGTEVHEVI